VKVAKVAAREAAVIQRHPAMIPIMTVSQKDTQALQEL
jgi:hypothetical protein